MGKKYHRRINKIERLVDSMSNMLQGLSSRIQRMEEELQKFRPQNQDERFGGCSQHHHQQPPRHYHRGARPHELKEEEEEEEGPGVSEFESFSEPPPSLQYYKQQPNDACESSSDEEEFESGCCLISRHLSEVDLIPLFKKDLTFDEFSEWVRDVERVFELYEIPEDEQVELVAYRLEEQVFLWWELIQKLSRQVHKQPIQDWTEMKKKLMARFLCLDNIFKDDQLNDMDGSSFSDEAECCLVNRHLSKVDQIPLLKKNLNYDDFCEWIRDVEIFFELYEIPEDEQVELVAHRLEGEPFSWWELIQNLWRRLDEQPIQDWIHMKKMLMGRFLSP